MAERWIKAVIFDLDGTLADTLPLCIRAFREAIAPLAGRAVTDEEIVATFGPSEEATVRQLLPDRYEEGIAGYWERYEQLHGEYPDLFPGIWGILAMLRERRVRLALVTGKSPRSARLSLARFGLEEIFEALEYGSPDGVYKDVSMQRILTQFSLTPDEAVYVGDAPTDIECARKAGVPMLSAAWAATTDRETLARLKPEALFDTVEELGRYLEARTKQP